MRTWEAKCTIVGGSFSIPERYRAALVRGQGSRQPVPRRPDPGRATRCFSADDFGWWSRPLRFGRPRDGATAASDHIWLPRRPVLRRRVAVPPLARREVKSR